MIPGELRGPILEHLAQAPFRDVLLNEVLGHVGDAVAGNRRFDLSVRGVEGQLPVDTNAKLLPPLLELPGVEPARRGLADVDAFVRDQFLRALRRGMCREIVGRGYGHEAPVRTDPNRESFSTLSPSRTPASNPSSTMLRSPL